MQPLDLVGAYPWRRVLFTTYALSLSFVEAVLLDRLVRGGGRQALILADPEGIRAALSEQGARRVGRDYDLEPIACTTGVFHPKLSFFIGDDDAHLLVGSGNLTFGGWGMNLEVAEHLHPSFAADVFDDAADMLELMSFADMVKCGIGSKLAQIAEELRQAASGATRRGNHRLLHSVGGSIGEQVAELADDLGGATRLTVVSPYFDVSGSGVSKLGSLLRCEDVQLHVHEAGPVRGPMGTNWPAVTKAQPVLVEDPFGLDDRKLHAKCFEILCRRGRILLSGSANATHAGLIAGNVEASLARIQRETLVGWTRQPAEPPVILPVADEADSDDGTSRVGILRAVLEGEALLGEIIASPVRGSASASIVRAAGQVDLGPVFIDAHGRFAVSAPQLEMQSWSGGRLVLRVQKGNLAAEGFVSIAAAARIIAAASPLAPRLLAMLSGTETPEDVAIILSWYREDPKRLMTTMPAAGSVGGKAERAPVWVSLADLQSDVTINPAGRPNDPRGEPAWLRALWLVRSAFSERRGPWKTGTDEDDAAEDEEDRENETARDRRLKREEAARQAALKTLDKLLDEMLAPRHEGAHAASAFALTHYLCDRARPAPITVRLWLNRIIAAFPEQALDASVATAALLLIATDDQERPAPRARRVLLRAKLPPENFVADTASIQAFIDILCPDWDLTALIETIRNARTAGEEVRAYLDAIEMKAPLPPLPGLEVSPHWQKLKSVFGDAQPLNRLLVIDYEGRACPKCRLELPRAAQEDLRRTGVTDHCRLILNRSL